MIGPKIQELVNHLLTTPSGLLKVLDRQRAFLAREYSKKVPCPECGRAVSYIEAVDDSFTFDSAADFPCRCPECNSALVKILPFFGNWYWMKKSAYDRASKELSLNAK